MRRIKSPIFILTIGLLTGVLAGCNLFKKKNATKDPLVIPAVDVTSLNVNLPALPTRNTGTIRSDDTYDYIDMYEFSDFHGAVHFEKHSDGDYAGLTRLATYMDNKRSSNPGGTLLLSAGDMFQGSAESNLTRGYMVNYAMHYMGFDAMAVGNHEFDWNTDWLKKNAELTYNGNSIPFLGSNIKKDGEIPAYLKKSTVITRGAYKIGIIGVMGSDLESSVLKSALDGCEFVQYTDIVVQESARLRSEEGCQAVVLLAHQDASHIETTSGIDAVFGGHAHKDRNTSYTGVPALATANYGQSVAHIGLKFNKSTKEFAGTDGVAIESMTGLAENLVENADVNSIMDQYAPEINKIKNIKLGTANAELKIDGALINICTETIFNVALESLKANNPTIDTNKVVASFHNAGGGIRDNIAAGEITYGNVYKSFPFDNEIVLFSMTGSEAKTKLRLLKDLGCYRLFENASYFDANERYYFVTTDYLAFSEKAMGKIRELTDEDLIRTGKVVRDEVANSIYQLDNLKNEELVHTKDYHYTKIPMSF